MIFRCATVRNAQAHGPQGARNRTRRSPAPTACCRALDDDFVRACRSCWPARAAWSSPAWASPATSAASWRRPSPAPARRPSCIRARPAHGDLGMIMRQDAVLAISYSGETGETRHHPAADQAPGRAADLDDRQARARRGRQGLRRAPRRLGRAGSLPAEPGPYRQHHGDPGDGRRPCRGPARKPAASRPEDFALSHPGGSLGRRAAAEDRRPHAQRQCACPRWGSRCRWPPPCWK